MVLAAERTKPATLSRMGVPVPEGGPTSIWLQDAGLTWTAEKRPVVFMDGAGKLQEYPDRYILERSDNCEPLSIVSDKYKIVQPLDAVNFAMDITQAIPGLKLVRGGSLLEGRRICLLAKYEDVGFLQGDELARYIMFTTSYDLKKRTIVSQQSLRLICSNGMTVLEQGENAFSRSHASEVDFAKVKGTMKMLDASWDRYIRDCEMFTETEAGDSEEYFMDVFYPKVKRKAKGFKLEAAKTKVDVLQQALLMGPGQQLTTCKGTVWGLLNAVTWFVDHRMSARSTDQRYVRSLFGDGRKIKQRAYVLALEKV